MRDASVSPREMPVTAGQIFESALALHFEYPGQDRDFKALFLPLLNLVLAESFPAAKSIADARGEMLCEPFTAASMEDEIPYAAAITRVALPYGIASFFYEDAGDTLRAQDYRNRYITALRDAAAAPPGQMRDVYGGAPGERGGIR